MNAMLWAVTTVGSAAGGSIAGYLFAVYQNSGEPLALVVALFCMAILVLASVLGALLCARTGKPKHKPENPRHSERPITESELESLG
jgi:hypothetical protein